MHIHVSVCRQPEQELVPCHVYVYKTCWQLDRETLEHIYTNLWNSNLRWFMTRAVGAQLSLCSAVWISVRRKHGGQRQRRGGLHSKRPWAVKASQNPLMSAMSLSKAWLKVKATVWAQLAHCARLSTRMSKPGSSVIAQKISNHEAPARKAKNYLRMLKRPMNLPGQSKGLIYVVGVLMFFQMSRPCHGNILTYAIRCACLEYKHE